MSFWRGSGTTHQKDLSISFETHPAVVAHLKKYFGDPPRTAFFEPIPRGGLWIIARERTTIIGCIRYRYVDHVDGESIYVVDCFCIHPRWRRQGYASAMLCTLRDYATPRGMPRAIFLKEGAPLPFAQPLVSGGYWYRSCGGQTIAREGTLSRCPTPLAHRLIAIRQSMAPHALTLLDRDAPTQEWWIYRTSTIAVLACVQDTHQRDLHGKKMGWFTAWVVLHAEAEEAARDAIADVLSYESVWFPAVAASRFSPTWKPDGAFHWYAYQWNTTRKIDPNIYVMVH